jgi:hypothetical protein
MTACRAIVRKDDVISIVMLVAFLPGVTFYGIIEKRLGFSYTDEICAIILLLAYCRFNVFTNMLVRKATLMVACALIFYLFYSVYIGSNCLIAIFSDMFVVAKPFIACLTIWEMQPRFSPRVLSLFRGCAKFVSVYAMFVALLGLNAVILIFGHPAQLASTALAASMIYLLSVDLSKKNLIIHSLMLSVGILSFRSKAIGEFILDMAFIWGLYNSFVRKSFRIKWYHYVGCSTILAVIGFVVRTKIKVYFIDGLSDLANLREARSALYVTSIRIAQDYFPFGSGYASFASWFSGVYYSKLYAKYGLTGIWGLSKEWYDFVSDTFYPQVLSQFGIFGLLLFLFGAGFVLRKCYKYYRNSNKTLSKAKNLYIVFCVITYFLIESIADSSFVNNRGLFMMMILGIALTELFREDEVHSTLNRKAA